MSTPFRTQGRGALGLLWPLFAGLMMCVVFLGPSRVAAAQITPTQFQTENGMRVLSLEQDALPIVTIQALVRAGGSDDPKSKIGLANMAAVLLEAGTAKRSALALSEALDSIGADLSINASKDFTTIQIRVLKKDIETGFDLLSDLLIHPKFEPEEIARIRKQIAGEILAQQDQPGIIARIAFQEMIYGDHPYRYPNIGLDETIQKIHRRDLVRFHNRYYQPENTILAVVGDLTEAEAKTLVRTYFGAWEKGSASFFTAHPSQPLPTSSVKRIEKDLSQATVILGHVGIDRANSDYYAIQVMNYILGGGGFSSRMMKDVRDDKGLVYSIYSHFSANRFPGAFSVTFQTKNSSTAEAIRAVLEALNNIRNTGVTETELSEAKSYLTGSFPLRIDTTRKIASYLTTLAFHDLGLDYLESYVERIKSVTREDVFRVALKYLHPKHMAVVAVGQQEMITLESIKEHVSD